MDVQLYKGRAGSGKTEFALEQVQESSRAQTETVFVTVPTQFQLHMWRQRFAQKGGGWGVTFQTFEQLVQDCLHLVEPTAVFIDTFQKRQILIDVVRGHRFAWYQKIKDKPGFIELLGRLIVELKEAAIDPAQFLAKVGEDARLKELGVVYQLYEEALIAYGWLDREGIPLHFIAYLEQNREWMPDLSFWVLDGFGEFSTVQLQIVALLAARINRVLITVTGPVDGGDALKRFSEVNEKLDRLVPVSESLTQSYFSGMLAELEQRLFVDTVKESAFLDERVNVFAGKAALNMKRVANRGAEVRTALRWAKEQLANDPSLRPRDILIIGRQLQSYDHFVREYSMEFDLPVRSLHQRPLKENSVIGILLDLFQLGMIDGGTERLLARQQLLDCWRSPYFSWQLFEDEMAHRQAAEWLDQMSRAYSVIDLESQWRDGFRRLKHDIAFPRPEDRDQPKWSFSLVEAELLEERFWQFVDQISFPREETAHYYVAQIRQMLGLKRGKRGTGLNLIGNIDSEAVELADIVTDDLAAVTQFDQLLNGALWVAEHFPEQAIGNGTQLYHWLRNEVEESKYERPLVDRDVILVGDVNQLRGLSCRVAVVLGLGEDEFPAQIKETPFLRDSDRKLLHLPSQIVSYEQTLFYEAVSRATDKLLLLRATLDDDGNSWIASPYWEEVCRLFHLKDKNELIPLTQMIPKPSGAASIAELVESFVSYPEELSAEGYQLIGEMRPTLWARIEQAADVLNGRYHAPEGSIYHGRLTEAEERFVQLFDKDYLWSPSQLESYQQCPHLFYVQKVLHLREPDEPQVGLDPRIEGSIFHDILESYYRDSGSPEKDSASLDQLIDDYLGQAPEKLGFQPTAWWEKSKEGLKQIVQATVMALDEQVVAGEKRLVEQGFWGRDGQALRIPLDEQGTDYISIQGKIDRIELYGDGSFTVIDYKTAGVNGKYSLPNLKKGVSLQLPIYLLAARDALQLGEARDGFYWHLKQNVAGSNLTGFKSKNHQPEGMDGVCDEGVEGAIETAVFHIKHIVSQIRAGKFTPNPPVEGCPRYCPAASYCVSYKKGRF